MVIDIYALADNATGGAAHTVPKWAAAALMVPMIALGSVHLLQGVDARITRCKPLPRTHAPAHLPPSAAVHIRSHLRRCALWRVPSTSASSTRAGFAGRSRR